MTIQDALVTLFFGIGALLWIAIWIDERRHRRRMDRDRAAWAAMFTQSDRLPTAPEDTLAPDRTPEDARQAYFDQSARTCGGTVADYIP